VPAESNWGGCCIARPFARALAREAIASRASPDDPDRGVSDHAGEVGRMIAFGSRDLDPAAILSAIERSSGRCVLCVELVSGSTWIV
jgi:hypothetical protein